MQLIFVHGWSVTNTDTYGGLPKALSNAAETYGLDIDIRHVHLGRYISFHDEVTVEDISRAMDKALRDLPGNTDTTISPFSCITHSTGGPVVRHWVDSYYGSERLEDLPLQHLVMLAPANHGSALAKLGKTRVGRIKSWFQGVEPGQGVLDWLSLGSIGQWTLNKSYLDYEYAANSFYPFVLTGQGIDGKMYDFLNSYLVEKGSDGVVRVAGANMNYRYFSLMQSKIEVLRKRPLTHKLLPDGGAKEPAHVPLGVYNTYSHSGNKMGIMRSVDENDTDSMIVKDIIKCLQVSSPDDYTIRAKDLDELTTVQQDTTDRFCMLIFGVSDDQGKQICNDDYDLFLLGGGKYSPERLPEGFFEDRQMNDPSCRLVYYLDADKMSQIQSGKFGIRVVARPSKGFSYYVAGEFRSEDIPIDDILAANQTTYIDITLHRFVDENVFRFDPANESPVNFKKIHPAGKTLADK